MSVKEILTHIEEGVSEIVSEASEKLRRSMYLDVVEQLDCIREALGLSIVGCEDCGVDGLYDCMECGLDFCGCCGERVEGGFLCHGCRKTRAAKGTIIQMTRS